MKTRLLTLILALFSFTTYAQDTAIPDLQFENYLEYHNANGDPVLLGDASSMGDGIEDNHLVPTTKINGVGLLNVISQNINSLEGIEDFAALVGLYCGSNNLTDLDLTLNNNLVVLNCQDNLLTNLSLPNTLSLVTIYCDNNQLMSLDISNNGALQILSCENNQIDAINLVGHSDLEVLNIGSNSLMDLDVSTNTKLYNLNCSDNSISLLDTSNLFDLFYLNCSQNLLTDIDLTNNFQLVQLIISSNDLQPDFNVSFSGSLIYLDCSGNPNLQVLTVMGPLTTLYASNCSLVGVYYSDSTDLQELDLSHNNLSGLSIANNPNVTNFYCHNNNLTSLDLRNGNIAGLTTLTAGNNSGLTCIDVDDETVANNKTDAGDWLVDAGTNYSTDCATMGVEEFSWDLVSIYPNPVENKLYVDLKTEGSYHLTDIFGQEIKKGTLISSQNELDIHNLSNGLYFLNIDSKKGHATQKIIKN